MKLYNRGSSYYTILTIPRCLVSEYGKKQIWKSLRTNDYKLAKLRAEFETMAIRQKLLNDVKKIKAQNQTADLYFDDDDEETDDIQVEDKMDFSQFSDEDFLNADDKTISLMGNETFSKYHKIKYAYDKKMARINKIRNSTIEYDQREAEDFAYDWLLAKAQHETKRLQNVTNKAEERKYYQDLLNAFEYKYTQWDYRDIENEVKTYFYEKIISQPSPDTKDIVLNAFMRAKIQFLRYIIEYIKGYAFNSHGKPTHAPTPRGTLVRELAFGDKSPNVIYLARPCQYIKSPMCSQRHWTTARFAPEIINAEYETIRQIAGNNPVVLVGFSGGAQVAGLVATAKRGLNVTKIITIAGNLDHLAWTQYHNLPPLNESMNLESYRTQFAKLPQIHYVGSNDEVIPLVLVRKFVGNDDLIVEVNGASHNEGWESIYNQVWSEK